MDICNTSGKFRFPLQRVRKIHNYFDKKPSYYAMKLDA